MPILRPLLAVACLWILAVVPTPLLGADPTADSDSAIVPDLSGTWSGSWESYQSGHDGPMTATFSQIGEGCYEVRFKGRFWGVLPFKYNVTLSVTEVREGVVYLSGSQRLPLFGTFSYSAQATETCFSASYCAKKDHGAFTLSRCCR